MADETVLPTEVMNALIGPVYDELTEDQCFDSVADDIVRRQLEGIGRFGYGLRALSSDSTGETQP